VPETDELPMDDSGASPINPDAPDHEPTGDAAFTDEATYKLGDATEEQTNQVADEEDGGTPDEPQPEQYPAPTEEPAEDGGDEPTPGA